MLASELTQDTDIRPISDLRNKFAEIANYVQGGNTVIFTRNGYGCMVTMSFDAFKSLTNQTVRELNRADDMCESDPRHYGRDESLAILRKRMKSRRDAVQA